LNAGIRGKKKKKKTPAENRLSAPNSLEGHKRELACVFQSSAEGEKVGSGRVVSGGRNRLQEKSARALGRGGRRNRKTGFVQENLAKNACPASEARHGS